MEVVLQRVELADLVSDQQVAPVRAQIAEGVGRLVGVVALVVGEGEALRAEDEGRDEGAG